MTYHIDSQAVIGHVHLRVSNLDRSVAFYRDLLGFSVTSTMRGAVFLSTDGEYHHHLGLNVWESAGGSRAAAGSVGLYHFAILFSSRKALAAAVSHVLDAKYPLVGAADHGVSEAIYLEDPDGNGIELYVDRPSSEWERDSSGNIVMVTLPLDLDDLLAQK